MVLVLFQGEIEEGAALPLGVDDPFQMLSGLGIGAEAQHVPAPVFLVIDETLCPDLTDRGKALIEVAGAERADDGELLGHLFQCRRDSQSRSASRRSKIVGTWLR